MKRSKRFKENLVKIEKSKAYDMESGLALVKELANAKFDETVELTVKLGVDPKHADQMVRGRVVLPSGTGKEVRVMVFTKGKNEEIAKAAGADYVGLEDYIQKILDGWLDFDVVIATPDVMGQVGKNLGKVLGTKGLMPNPKSGTVTPDVESAVKEVKGGKIEFRVDRYAILHVAIGKASFELEQLVANFRALMDMVIRLKPASAKGQYVKAIGVSTTMSPGVKFDRAAVLDELKSRGTVRK